MAEKHAGGSMKYKTKIFFWYKMNGKIEVINPFRMISSISDGLKKAGFPWPSQHPEYKRGVEIIRSKAW